MRKITILILIFSGSVFAYTASDLDTANFLTNQGIIQKQTNPKNYRLDYTITRAEAIGIALKIKGTVLPDSYVCKGYFSDTVTNDWKCRAIEIAADNGIITRVNTKARPNDTITRAEALGVLLKAGGIEIENFSQDYFSRNWVGESDVNWTDISEFTQYWQRNVFFSFKKKISRTVPGQGSGIINDSGSVSYNIRPNSPATREEIFAFTKDILSNFEIGCGSCSTVTVKLAHTEEDNAKGRVWRYWPLVNRVIDENDYGCTVAFGDNRTIDELLQGTPGNPFVVKNIEGIWWYGMPSALTSLEGSTLIHDNTGKYIVLIWNRVSMETCLKSLNIPSQKITDIDILKIYYHNIGAWDKKLDAAYKMRSPTRVSLDTFQSWYKNVTNVVFREDTLKNLGNNTYEFLVDITENGVRSTYKVKSKVDVANFTIDNISSIKQ